jgi:hypothetical protein
VDRSAEHLFSHHTPYYAALFLCVYLECHCFCYPINKQLKRIYVPVPDPNVRRLLVKSQAQLKGQAFKLSSKLPQGFS